ncbi:MAG: glycoside hydrolase family 36 protein [Bacteroidota bacterium]
MANLTLAGWTPLLQVEGIESLRRTNLTVYTQDASGGLDWDCEVLNPEVDLSILRFQVKHQGKTMPPPTKLVWSVPAINLRGAWTSNFENSKRLRAEWESEMVAARTAFEAPVITLFGHDDQNVHTFACSDAINKMVLGAGLREESGWMYCSLQLFTEPLPSWTDYTFDLWLDSRKIRYEKALTALSTWWLSYLKTDLPPVPDLARQPVYSTWYNFHQDLDEKTLLEECALAYELGYRSIIIDDGWQTDDDQRGYAFTGDWLPERFPDMAGFVKKIHQTGMKILLWYSVPFFGKASQAYQKFHQQFLTQSVEWNAAIIDPRYPAIREYLISIYTKALQEWKLDGFKLDFIDQVISNEHTDLTLANGRDYASVNAAVERLMLDVREALTTLHPEILIEFRQHYIGPAMRQFGQLFRAHDCPNDAVSNRVRTIDLRLLSGTTVIHSDMLMWNTAEPVELAALQLLNVFCAVPQLSVQLKTLPEAHLKMVQYYTDYWVNNRLVLLDGELRAADPLAGYPLVRASNSDKTIVLLYADRFLVLDQRLPNYWDCINAKSSVEVIIKTTLDQGAFEVQIYDCQGDLQQKTTLAFHQGLYTFEVPPSGSIQANRL